VALFHRSSTDQITDNVDLKADIASRTCVLVENTAENVARRSACSAKCLIDLVGAGRFELPTPCSRSKCSSRTWLFCAREGPARDPVKNYDRAPRPVTSHQLAENTKFYDGCGGSCRPPSVLWCGVPSARRCRYCNCSVPIAGRRSMLRTSMCPLSVVWIIASSSSKPLAWRQKRLVHKAEIPGAVPLWQERARFAVSGAMWSWAKAVQVSLSGRSLEVHPPRKGEPIAVHPARMLGTGPRKRGRGSRTRATSALPLVADELVQRANGRRVPIPP
jgi:hypothetical protein